MYPRERAELPRRPHVQPRYRNFDAAERNRDDHSRVAATIVTPSRRSRGAVQLQKYKGHRHYPSTSQTRNRSRSRGALCHTVRAQQYGGRSSGPPIQHRDTGSRDRPGQDRQASGDDDDDETSASESDPENARGQFNCPIGTMLGNGRYRYTRKLGMGTFGKVIECFDEKHRRYVAIKVVRAVRRYTESARIEANTIQRVNECELRMVAPSWITRSVVMLNHFIHNGHECLVFERLGPSLLDEQKRIQYAPFDIEVIRYVGRQVLQGLNFLHEGMSLIHTDIKMENILFVDKEVPNCTLRPASLRNLSKYSVKLIDFGGATFRAPNNLGVINTRQYRAPEVVLNFPWDCASDVWGVAAVLMELYLGDLLFQPSQVAEHLAMMEHLHGHRFPHDMQRLSMERLSERYFDSLGRVDWDVASSRVPLTTLWEKILRRRDVSQRAMEDIFAVMSGMLELDPRRRISAREALRYRFFQEPYGW